MRRFCKTGGLVVLLVAVALSHAAVVIRLSRPLPESVRVADLLRVDIENTADTACQGVWFYAELAEDSRGTVLKASSDTFELPPGRTVVPSKFPHPLRISWCAQGYKAWAEGVGPVPPGSYDYVARLEPRLGADGVRLIVDSPEVLQLLSPACGATLHTNTPFFRWCVADSEPPRFSYVFTLVAVQPSQTREEAMSANQALLSESGIAVPRFRWPDTAPSLRVGQWYAWQVRAMARGGEVVRSRVRKFIVAPQPQADSQSRRLTFESLWDGDSVSGLATLRLTTSGSGAASCTLEGVIGSDSGPGRSFFIGACAGAGGFFECRWNVDSVIQCLQVAPPVPCTIRAKAVSQSGREGRASVQVFLVRMSIEDGRRRGGCGGG